MPEPKSEASVWRTTSIAATIPSGRTSSIAASANRNGFEMRSTGATGAIDAGRWTQVRYWVHRPERRPRAGGSR